jgi:magnesium transporter
VVGRLKSSSEGIRLALEMNRGRKKKHEHSHASKAWRRRSGRSHKRGLPPGTLVPRPTELGPETRLRILVVDYGRGFVTETELHQVEDLLPYMGTKSVTWAQVEGLHDADLMSKLGEVLGIHPLALEDIVNGHQRPKLEEFGADLFLVLKALKLGADGVHVDEEQISLILRAGMVISFRDRSDELFAPVRARLVKGGNRFQQFGPDYLVYSLFDLLVDDYFHLGDAIDDALEVVEAEMADDVGTATMAKVQVLKRELIAVKRQLAPTRDVSAALLRTESPLISKPVLVFMRDLHDHVLRVSEGLDSSREMAAGLMEMYMSFVSNRMNEVMKVLTLFSTTFIPLTFLAGIYGMNFDRMPELHWPWAYPVLWGVFVAVPVVMLAVFRRRGWL